MEWFEIENINEIDSPALLVFPDRVIRNIELAKKVVNGDCSKLRPHVKTNKMAEVCRLMIDAGIDKFKCATIAEAEMLGISKALDVLLAYQPVGPKIKRLAGLIKSYPETRFSCLVDNLDTARQMDNVCAEENMSLSVFIDLNVGMDRTGILPGPAVELIPGIQKLGNLRVEGIHAYDGHIHQADIEIRKAESDRAYSLAKEVHDKVQPLFPYPLILVIGGTPTFVMHAERENVECSPGTFVFWDRGYRETISELDLEYAAVLISRVISIIDKYHVCIDLGYKSVAAESPLPRVYFLNHPQAKPVAQSEEHLVLEVDDSDKYKVGDIMYGIPKHICPTVALYEKVFVAEAQKAVTTWTVLARDRKLKN